VQCLTPNKEAGRLGPPELVCGGDAISEAVGPFYPTFLARNVLQFPEHVYKVGPHPITADAVHSFLDQTISFK
jgi:hypothetical protein